jgi:GT2 family glycosyltransferase
VTGDTVRISVVVPAYDAWDTLPKALDALRRQVDRPDRELLLVESSGTRTREELTRRWPWARVLAPGARTLPGHARNLALEHARGELLAFTDADAIPEPEWLDELERALRPDVAAVAGAVVNGTPGSSVGTGGYLLEFAAWLPGRPGVPLHGATCNLLIRRDVLTKLGGFRTDLWPGEDTVLTFPLGERGRLVFAPRARVTHLNRTRFPDLVRHQYRLGVSFSEVCRQVDFPLRTATRLPLALVAGPLRVPVLWLRLRRWRVLPRRQASVWPAAFAGACAWSAGLTVAAARRGLGHRRRSA